MKIRFLAVIFLISGFAGSAAADDFGARFSGNPPAAFLDGGASIMFKNIEPAAGEEEDGVAVEHSVTTEDVYGPPAPGAEMPERDEQQSADKPAAGNGLVRIYPQAIKK